MQYVLHVFLLRRALEAAKFSCDLKAVYGRESARAFMARRPCVGAMAESSLGQGTTPRHRLAVSFPHRARCFKHSLVRLSPCADKWNRQGRAGGAQGKGCGRHARNSPVVKYGRGRVRSRKLQGQRANRGRWARAVSRAWRGCSFSRRKGAGEFYLIHRH